MKISHFTSSERGGSGVLTLRLHRALLKLGQNSAAYLRDVDEKKDEFIFRKQFTTNSGFLFLERLGYSLENRIRKPAAPSYFSRLRLAHFTPSPREDMEIVHLHWVGRWLDLPSFVNSLPLATPIVWTVHDMSPLAGGCFTDFGCGEFEKGCGVCPLLKFPFNRIWARQELQAVSISAVIKYHLQKSKYD